MNLTCSSMFRFIFLCLIILSTNANPQSTLKQVSIIFRHGERLPDILSTYPNSPYKNASLYPHNIGDLTLKGQNTMYNKGQEIYQRYSEFLGNEYYINLVESISSSYTRCVMSSQALHAGLFGQTRNLPMTNLKWQAVLYSVIPADEDNLISIHLTCPALIFDVNYPQPINDSDVLTAFEAVQNYSGFTESITYREVLQVHDSILTGVDSGLPIHEEFSPFYPEPLQKAALLGILYTYQNKTNLIGPLFRRIAQSALAKANGELQPKDRRLYLYSGHDMNILLSLQALNYDWYHEWIHYGAYLIFELHDIKGTYGFKVFLQNNYTKPLLLDIPGCGSFCPLRWFVELGETLIQGDICDKTM